MALFSVTIESIWMDEWMVEARQLIDNDNPTENYLAYTVELKETHEVIGSVGCQYKSSFFYSPP